MIVNFISFFFSPRTLYSNVSNPIIRTERERERERGEIQSSGSGSNGGREIRGR